MAHMRGLLYVPLLAGFAFATEKEPLTADGRPFMINQKDYKIPTFEMLGYTFNDTWGFPDASFFPLDNRGYHEILEKCDFEADSIPFYEYSPLSSVIYSPNTEKYDAFYGFDLIPENKHNYPSWSDFTIHLDFDHAKEYAKETIMMQRCRIPEEDGGAWHVQRIGPFVSRGGYDWWQLAWPDLGMFSEALAKHPEGIDVTKQIFSPVTRNGTRLSYPPLHTHHVHALTQPGTRPRLNSRPMCVQQLGLGIQALDEMVREKMCYNLSMFFEQHGDHICQPEDDGIDCLTQGDKNIRRLVAPLDVEGEINDVRPTNSEPMEWFYQIAMRWKPIDPKEPVISQTSLFGPGTIIIPSQITKSLTAPTPTHAESVMIYSGKLTVSGDLRRGKIHAHSAIYQSSMLLLGEFSDFGLSDSKFEPVRGWKPLITTELGFRDNEDLGQHILYHMGKSQEYYDKTCVDKDGKPKATGIRNPVCRRPRPDWICGGVVNTAPAVFEGVEYEFDRRPKSFCKPWSFTEGDSIVIVGFNKKVTKPIQPSNPGKIPEFIGQHMGFFLSYVDRKRGHSALETVLHVHHGIFHYFHRKLSPNGVLARMVIVILAQGPSGDEGSLYFLEWMFCTIFTLLALWLGSCAIWLARKVPVLDDLMCRAYQTVLGPLAKAGQILLEFDLVASTAALRSARAGGHAYEMVAVSEDNDADDAASNDTAL